MSPRKQHRIRAQRKIRMQKPKNTRVSRRSAAHSSMGKSLGQGLRIEKLRGLTSELQGVRQYPPVTRRKDGKYEGDILGFVRGLRLSARVLYCLRDLLSGTGLEVSWGHLLNEKEQSCSPECDIIIHEPGVVQRWNGFRDPIMNFSFIKAERVRLVVSCKSLLNSIDADYPKTLKKYGIKKVALFAESCEASHVKRLRKRAVEVGYAGMWCLYTTDKKDFATFITNDGMLVEFVDTILSAVAHRRQRNKKKANTGTR